MRPWVWWLPLALLQCGSTPDSQLTGSIRESILGGQTVTDPDSPVLFLSGPEGTCTAVLIAPNLVMTARHCTAQTPEGMFTCTTAGDLVATGAPGGQIGADDPPSSLTFFTNRQVVANTEFSNPPDAVGITTISTNTPTVCRDDIAFVVLNQPIPGVTPASLRLTGPTVAGESVSALGYGLTSQSGDPVALRVRTNASIVGVGPDTPNTSIQLAPLRAVRLGPDDVTCIGDSGGPMMSSATGAVIAIVSLGNQANANTPTCSNGGGADTTGPRLEEYNALALSAFAAAGASPTLEPGSPPEAEPPQADEAGSEDAGEDAAEDAGPIVIPGSEPIVLPAIDDGASCSTQRGRRERATGLGVLAMTLAMTAAAVGRRRR
jgi:Trypsin